VHEVASLWPLCRTHTPKHEYIHVYTYRDYTVQEYVKLFVFESYRHLQSTFRDSINTRGTTIRDSNIPRMIDHCIVILMSTPDLEVRTLSCDTHNGCRPSAHRLQDDNIPICRLCRQNCKVNKYKKANANKTRNGQTHQKKLP